MILAIDPGPEESAYVVLFEGRPAEFAKASNNDVLDALKRLATATTACTIEQVASYGMPVGAEVFETVYWSGRFAQAYGVDRVHRIPRLKVKLHLCHDSRAKDGNIRQALIDRFGGKDTAIGSKRAPGALYGVSGDVWAALALAITFTETHGVPSIA